jgi:type III secretion protein L
MDRGSDEGGGMSYILLRADAIATTLAEDPVVPAADVGALTDAMALLDAAAKVRADTDAAVARATEAGRAEGFAAGREEGRAAVAADIDAERFALALRDREVLAERQGAIAHLALEVVRRIASSLGPEETMAAIVARAAADVAPDTALTVRVAPAVLDAVAERLGDRAGLTVEADPALDPLDCVIETTLSRVQAGLDTQLALIERHWSSQ